jgi:hypothetical protein
MMSEKLDPLKLRLIALFLFALGVKPSANVAIFRQQVRDKMTAVAVICFGIAIACLVLDAL